MASCWPSATTWDLKRILHRERGFKKPTQLLIRYQQTKSLLQRVRNTELGKGKYFCIFCTLSISGFWCGCHNYTIVWLTALSQNVLIMSSGSLLSKNKTKKVSCGQQYSTCQSYLCARTWEKRVNQFCSLKSLCTVCWHATNVPVFSPLPTGNAWHFYTGKAHRRLVRFLAKHSLHNCFLSLSAFSLSICCSASGRQKRKIKVVL